MQHGTQQEQVLDILENAIAVLRGLRERQGIKVFDVIVNLETAHLIVSKLREERSPFDTLREDPFEGCHKSVAQHPEHDDGECRFDRTMQERHPIDREAARQGFTE
jgi:hypothetical protein